jgi:hypothetical protein
LRVRLGQIESDTAVSAGASVVASEALALVTRNVIISVLVAVDVTSASIVVMTVSGTVVNKTLVAWKVIVSVLLAVEVKICSIDVVTVSGTVTTAGEVIILVSVDTAVTVVLVIFTLNIVLVVVDIHEEVEYGVLGDMS